MTNKMKVVIFAGGLGTRISEESQYRPKPMIEVCGKPLLHHILSHYSHYGFNDFIICLGYKSEFIKEYFSNISLHNSNVTFDLPNGTFEVHEKAKLDWKVTLLDTGLQTMTGGRLLRVKDYMDDDNDSFMLTYGDGLSNVDINKLIGFHQSHSKLATVTAVRPIARFGSLGINKHNVVERFKEKEQEDAGWINGGFFVLNKKVFDYLDDDQTVLEERPLELLSEQNQLHAFKHSGFWHPCDTLRDKVFLDSHSEDNAPWKDFK
jgi:glucose-1-phosphate cytidylyltransferase